MVPLLSIIFSLPHMHLPLSAAGDATRINTLKAMLFPNSQFEVTFEDDQFHLFAEGEWQARHDDLDTAIADVADRMRGSVSITDGEGGEWDEPTICYPDWPKWPQVRATRIATNQARRGVSA